MEVTRGQIPEHSRNTCCCVAWPIILRVSGSLMWTIEVAWLPLDVTNNEMDGLMSFHNSSAVDQAHGLSENSLCGGGLGGRGISCRAPGMGPLSASHVARPAQ